MELSRSIVKQFADLTTGTDAPKVSENVYGTVVEVDGQFYAQIDGSNSDILTPISATIDIKDGDRVIVSVRNHIATATGNLNDPAAGIMRVNDMGELVIQAKTIFEGLSDGTTVIDGGCIQTGTIDAERINLKGTIISQYSVNGVDGWHEDMADSDYYRRDSLDGGKTWTSVYKFRGRDGIDGNDADVPGYITDTHIDGTKVESFHILGNKIEVVIPYNSDADENVGFILTDTWNNKSYRYLRIYGSEDNVPYTVFESPAHTAAWWDFLETYITGGVTFQNETFFQGDVYMNNINIDFSGSTCTGLYLTFS